VMGSAIWEFMWILDKMTKIDNDGVGWVLGGKPIKRQEIKEDLGIDVKNISRNLIKLEKAGYISLKRTPYGQIIKVSKAKKRYNNKVSSNKKRSYKKVSSVGYKRPIQKGHSYGKQRRQDSIDKTKTKELNSNERQLLSEIVQTAKRLKTT